MGLYIATTTNDNEDYVNVDVDKVGPEAMHVAGPGRYISMHSSTNSVDEEDNFLLCP